MSAPLSAVEARRAGWRELVEQSWPAVTASELLRDGAEVWRHDGFDMPSPEEAVALAATGRVVRFGQSVHLSLPVGAEATLPRLAFYLHRLRLDAASGLIRSTWLNPISIAHRTDLIVFGRSRRMWRDFSTSVVMRPEIVDRPTLLEASELQRTLLVSGKGDLLELLGLLEARCKPFAIVVHVAPQGCDEQSQSLIKVLPEFFHDVPIVALGYTGQTWPEPFPMHAWNTRLGDVVALREDAGTPTAHFPHIEVVAARDSVMDSFVKKLGFMVWSLKRKLEEAGGLSSEFSALMAVDRALRSLNVPFPVHEKGTLRHVRGGRYPIRMVESWLDIASRLKGRRGDIQELHSQIMAMIRQMIGDLAQATPGRTEALVQLCGDALVRKQRVNILVGGRRDAEILQNYLESRLGPEALEMVTVSKMDGATAVSPDQTDLAIYAGVLYPSRVHWLGLAARKKVVLCHPFEHERVCSLIQGWWRQYALASAAQGDKQRLWSLRWPENGYLCDETVDDESLAADPVPFTLLDIDGQYPPKMREARLEAYRGYDDWLDVLLAEPLPLHRDDELPTERTRDVVVLHLEGQSTPIRSGANQQMMRLLGEQLELCLARELDVGNELVILTSSEDRVATQRDLFDMFVQNNHGLNQTLRIAEKWQAYVDAAMERFNGSAVELNKHLRSQRLEVHNSTVQNWANGGVIGPQNALAIRLLADLAQVPNAEKMADMVAKAIVVVRNEHRVIGGDLRRAIAASRSRDISAVHIGTRRFARDVFDAMVQVVKVTRIERPALEQKGLNLKTIKDVALDFAMLNPGKVVFTSACERGLRTSTFADVVAFGRVLQVLVDGFYLMLSDHSKSLKEVEAMLASIPASYAGGMSEITKGKHDQHYFRIYEGEKVDISRHIKLGRAFDPRYTLRLHFHWDERRAKIVVHHAGEHLPTLSN